MNTPTPTPRTEAAWSATFDGQQMSAGRTARALRECSQQLETELAALTAERDAARARAERAEAELATERARLADLVADLSDACITLESAENDCDDYAMQNTAFKLMAVRNVFAAMKEGAK